VTKILNYVVLILAGYLCVSCLIIGDQNLLRIVVDVAIALLLAGAAAISIKLKTEQWPSMAIAVAGVCLVVWAIAGYFLGAATGVNEALVGMLCALLGVVAVPFQVIATKASFHNRTGNGLAEFMQVRMKDGNIICKSVLLGTMPETIYMRPGEICKAAALVDQDVILALPGILYRGWKANLEESKAKAAATTAR
jgi:hypothetical protein